MENYESIDKALNISETDIVPTKKVSPPKEVSKLNEIEKGQEAINGIMEVAGESASPRAYEVAGQLIKSVADTTDKLMDLQKKVKDVNEDNPSKTNNVTNNALFVGSTSELSKMLKKGFLNNKEEK